MGIKFNNLKKTTHTQDNMAHAPFAKPSRWRQLKNHIEKLTCDFWRSTHDYLLSLTKEDRKHIHDKLNARLLTRLTIKKPVKYGLLIANIAAQIHNMIFHQDQVKEDEKRTREEDRKIANKIAIKRALDASTVIHITEKIQEIHNKDDTIRQQSEIVEKPWKLDYDQSGLHAVSASSLLGSYDLEKAKDRTTAYYAFPLVLRGKARHHIVLLYVDTANKSVEFFDSKGLTVLDRKGATLLDGQTKLADVVDNIYRRFAKGSEWIFKENTKKVQRDSHSCGLTVLHTIEKRVNGDTFEKVIKEFPKYKDETKVRQGLIDRYLSSKEVLDPPIKVQ